MNCSAMPPTMAGKEAALFLPTGTEANLVGLLSHCQRGEEYIVGQGRITICTKPAARRSSAVFSRSRSDAAAADGSLPLDKVAAKIKPDDIHFAPTRLLSLENTHNGKVLPRDYLQEAWAFTRQRNLALHVDGARIFNAVVAYGCELRDIAQYCDSFTICLSKAWRSGRLAAARQRGVHSAAPSAGGKWSAAGCARRASRRRRAVRAENNVQRLQEDHDNAAWMAEQLRRYRRRRHPSRYQHAVRSRRQKSRPGARASLRRRRGY
ncbi:beta-eliminating lyase-related protein [Klebsiella pneumoniae subsp. pneumoniae]|nr:beta-eliminating lyase-related protein [Klebsiella pneumoniae subsp. pneumoniae]